jgi:cytochrome c
MTRRAATAARAAAVVLVCVAAPARAAEQGEAEFNNHCRTCHAIKPGDHRLGPSLYGVYGAKAGTARGYEKYSPGLRNTDLTWDEATLERFIENPDAVVPDNLMRPYPGIRDPAVRKRIIAFMKALDGSR